jgi:hypothetical protein
MQSGQLYTKWNIQKRRMDCFKFKKSSIVVERHGDKVAIFTNDQLKKSDFSTTIIKSYLVANYCQIGTKQNYRISSTTRKQNYDNR